MLHVPSEEIQVNTYTTSSQTRPYSLALGNGGWVTIWISDGQDGHQTGTYQQVFDETGAPVGAEQRVNTDTIAAEAFRTATLLSTGGWVVCWTGHDGYGTGSFVQAFDATGAPVGGQIQTNTYATNGQNNPWITALEGGGWVTTWVSVSQDGDGGGIYQRVFDADGTPLSDETQVNSTSAGYQYESRIVALAEGGWVVIWKGPDGDGDGIFQQVFDADGEAVGEETVVNVDTAGSQSRPALTALADGGWVVAWASPDTILQQAFNADGTRRGDVFSFAPSEDSYQSWENTVELDEGGWVVTYTQALSGNDQQVFQQLFNADGSSLGDATSVSGNLTGDQLDVSTQRLEDGGWVTAWIDDEGSSARVYQQIFDAEGNAVGSVTRVDSYDSSYKGDANVAVLKDGSWIVSWSSYGQDGSGDGVFQQRFESDGDVYGANDAPTGEDSTLRIKEDGSYRFAADDFGFADSDGETDAFSGVVITKSMGQGKLTLDGERVRHGDTIATNDLDNLRWTPTANAQGDAIGRIGFRVMDDGGTASGGRDTAQKASTIVFDVRPVTDVFKGTADADNLRGTTGSDVLDGRAGNDRLAGLGSADRFVFGDGYGRDTITDFDAAGKDHDIVDLRGLSSITSYADLRDAHLSQSGADTLITAGDDILVLRDTRVTDLDRVDLLL